MKRINTKDLRLEQALTEIGNLKATIEKKNLTLFNMQEELNVLTRKKESIERESASFREIAVNLSAYLLNLR